jgi:hypothetical protein
MNGKRFGLLMFVATFILGLAIVPAGSDGGKRRKLRADLKGFNEVPTLSTPGRGTFRAVINRDETEIRYRLDYRDTESAVTQSHIHLGQRHVNGGISVFLCTNLAVPPPPPPAQVPPACPPPGLGAEVTGTLTAADVTAGAAGQGLAAGEFAELIRAMRAGATYVNVHTTGRPGGEIRGQIRGDDDDDHRD